MLIGSCCLKCLQASLLVSETLLFSLWVFPSMLKIPKHGGITPNTQKILQSRRMTYYGETYKSLSINMQAALHGREVICSH